MAVQINIKNMKTYTKSIALAAFALALAGSAWSADTTVAGKWQGEFDSQIGVQKYTYEFKVDGTNLTGRAIGIRDEGTNNVAITEGKIVQGRHLLRRTAQVRRQRRPHRIHRQGVGR